LIKVDAQEGQHGRSEGCEEPKNEEIGRLGRPEDEMVIGIEVGDKKATQTVDSDEAIDDESVGKSDTYDPDAGLDARRGLLGESFVAEH
jgi:hypothetical protein